MPCKCCQGPCEGQFCCGSDDCCSEAISCITISIEGGPTFNVTGASYSGHSIFTGTFTCGDDPLCVNTIELQCPEDGVLIANSFMRAGCLRYDPDSDTFRCDSYNIPADPASGFGPDFIIESNWFGPHIYTCCPFFSQTSSPIGTPYDCACLQQDSVPRLITMTKCPPMTMEALKSMRAAMPRDEAMAVKAIERLTKPFPHPCFKGQDGGPCRQAQIGGVHTPDQCHLCWWYENSGAYHKLWGGGILIRQKDTYTNIKTGVTTDTIPEGKTGLGLPASIAPPGMGQRAWMLATAITKFVAQGVPVASAEEVDRRNEICKGCPFFMNDMCLKCGCWLPLKQKMVTEHCPLDPPKW